MNLIALMPPLSLIKRLKMYIQATFVFFLPPLYSTNIFFLLILISWLVTYLSYCTYYIVLNIHFKKLINIHFFLFDIDENYAIAKVKIKYPCKSL